MNEVEQQQMNQNIVDKRLPLKNELHEGNENIYVTSIFSKAVVKFGTVSLLLTVITCLHYDCL